MLIEFAGSSCLPAFNAYLGSTPTDALDFGGLYPVQKDWDTGDRRITCYLYRPDGEPMTGSLKTS